MARTEYDRTSWSVAGRVIGSATGWDSSDTFVMCLYDFEPHPDVRLPSAEFLTVDFENGYFETFNEDGTLATRADLVTVLASLLHKDDV